MFFIAERVIRASRKSIRSAKSICPVRRAAVALAGDVLLAPRPLKSVSDLKDDRSARIATERKSNTG